MLLEQADQAAYARGLRDAAAMLDMPNQTIRLHAGELSPDEMRCVQAVLGWKRRELLHLAGAPETNQPPQPAVRKATLADRLPLPISTTMEEASRLSGMGKSTLYQLINSGQVQAKKNGRITLILVDSLREHIARLPDWKADPRVSERG